MNPQLQNGFIYDDTYYDILGDELENIVRISSVGSTKYNIQKVRETPRLQIFNPINWGRGLRPRFGFGPKPITDFSNECLRGYHLLLMLDDQRILVRDLWANLDGNGPVINGVVPNFGEDNFGDDALRECLNTRYRDVNLLLDYSGPLFVGETFDPYDPSFPNYEWFTKSNATRHFDEEIYKRLLELNFENGRLVRVLDHPQKIFIFQKNTDFERVQLEQLSKTLSDSNLQNEVTPREFDYKRFLRSKQIDYLYHITHIDNVENILRFGLLSHSRANKLKHIDISMESVNTRRANRVDSVRNRPLHDYVPLYFNARNPMLFKRKNIRDSLVILCLESDLLEQENTIFTDGNAASNETRFFNSLTDLQQIDWDCVGAHYWADMPDGKRKRCAEVLVADEISASKICKVFCSNRDILRQLKNYVGLQSEYSSKMFFGENSI